MSCSCGTCNGCLSTDTISIPTGANGTNGTNGSNGVFGGFSGSWLFDDTTSSGPSSTNMRFNQVNLATATMLYIHNTNADSIDYENFLQSFINSNNYGLIRVWKRLDSTKFWTGIITNVVAAGSTQNITVTHVENNGTFTDEDELVVSFAASGATGASVGAAYVVDVDYAGTITAADAGPSVLGTVTVGAGALASNDDMLEFEAYYTSTDNASVGDIFYLSIGDQGYALDSNEAFASWEIRDTQACMIKGRIIRESSVLAHTVSEVAIDVSSTGIDPPSPTPTLSLNIAAHKIGSQTIAIDWSQANIIELGIINTANETITLTDLVVKFVQQGA